MLKLDSKTDTRILLDAISNDKIHLARFILDALDGKIIDSETDGAQTPLVSAVFLQDSEARSRFMNLLLQRGASVNRPDESGRTPLSYACEMGFLDAVKILVENGADPEAADSWGNTPLMYAVVARRPAVVEFLVRAFKRLGLQIDRQNKVGNSAVEVAKHLGHTECLQALRSLSRRIHDDALAERLSTVSIDEDEKPSERKAPPEDGTRLHGGLTRKKSLGLRNRIQSMDSIEEYEREKEVQFTDERSGSGGGPGAQQEQIPAEIPREQIRERSRRPAVEEVHVPGAQAERRRGLWIFGSARTLYPECVSLRKPAEGLNRARAAVKPTADDDDDDDRGTRARAALQCGVRGVSERTSDACASRASAGDLLFMMEFLCAALLLLGSLSALSVSAEQEVENLSGLSANPDREIFVVRENETTCLMAEFAVKFLIPYDVLALNGIDLITEQASVSIPRGAQIAGKCGNTESELHISWINHAFTFRIFFSKEKHTMGSDGKAKETDVWKMNKVQLVYDTSEKTHFINAYNPGKHTASTHLLSALVTPAGRSYVCSAQQTLTMISSDHQKGVSVFMYDTQIQPFDIASDFVFSE
ncbi:lysosome-associated membrane glycoprotein, partial [Pimephales promelas]